MNEEFKTVAVGEYCLVKTLPTEDQNVGGVIVSASQSSLFALGKVLSVGKGEKILKLDLEEGDIIYFNDIERNTVASDSNGDASIFVRHDFIYGKKITNLN
jgi:co-chaperonin GroES (HSP10)